MTENDYVATATAEKRLREVLAERLGEDPLAHRLGDILLAVAEITYLPRKKSVSILLKVPDTATLPKRSGASVTVGAEMTKDEAVTALVEGGQRAQAVEDAAVASLGKDLPHDRGVSVVAPGTVGRFQPKAIDTTDYDGDDEFFTE